MEDEALKARVTTLESIVIDKDAELEKLKAELEEIKSTPAVAAGGLEIFSQGKKKYQFTAPAFNYEGKRITSAEAIKDKELLKALVEKGAGVIKEVQ